MIPLYRAKRPMRLAVFGSGSGTTLEALLQERCPLYEISLLFSNRPCRFEEIAKLHRIPHLFLPSLGRADREAYDEEIVRLIGPDIDFILLAGYMRIVSAPLLKAFENRIINTHPGDLAALDQDGRRKYTGKDAVQKALDAGEPQTRSCVILVDADIDTGPVLVSGPRVPHTRGDSAKEHQQKQKQLSDYPACIAAVRYLAEGRLALGPSKTVYFDGRQQPRCGVDLHGDPLCAESSVFSRASL